MVIWWQLPENEPYVCLAGKFRTTSPVRKPWDVSDSGGWFWRAGESWARKEQLLLQGPCPRLKEKPTCGNLGAVLKQNWILDLCLPTAAKPIGRFTVMHWLPHEWIWTYSCEWILSSSARKSCFQIPKTSFLGSGREVCFCTAPS